jgi:spore maturation protein CgeB
MRRPSLRIVILGLSITSSWGNGHATTYRALVRHLVARGHRVLFLERDVPWYASSRDLDPGAVGEVALYKSLSELRRQHARDVAEADAVIVGSYVPDGVEVGRWVIETARGVAAFYDIDAPITLAALERNACEYISVELVPRYDLYLSFTGGPLLQHIERELRAARVRPLYCSVDPGAYHPEAAETRWDLGFLGTYSVDRQAALERFLIDPAVARPGKRFVVAGAQYPEDIVWPDNVERVEHLPPERHRGFFARRRFTLNITREEMLRAGYSPSVRLFEAAACGVPIVTDAWDGLDEFFVPNEEILVARSTDDALEILDDVNPDKARAIGLAGRRRVLASHTGAHRAAELERWLLEAREALPARPPRRGGSIPANALASTSDA